MSSEPSITAGSDLDGVVRLGAEDAERISTLLSDAFSDYPMMRFVLGEERPYSRRLRLLNDYFVSVRVGRGDPMIGILDGSKLVGVALIGRPDAAAAADPIEQWRETWRELGPGARERYRAIRRARAPFFPGAEDDLQLDMLAVDPELQGRGLGSHLLGGVHALAREISPGCGVSLTTERSDNVSMYERRGYSVLGRARVAETLTTWGLRRPGVGSDQPPAPEEHAGGGR